MTKVDANLNSSVRTEICWDRPFACPILRFFHCKTLLTLSVERKLLENLTVPDARQARTKTERVVSNARQLELDRFSREIDILVGAGHDLLIMLGNVGAHLRGRFIPVARRTSINM